jgi:hypothetical protein
MIDYLLIDSWSVRSSNFSESKVDGAPGRIIVGEVWNAEALVWRSIAML